MNIHSSLHVAALLLLPWCVTAQETTTTTGPCSPIAPNNSGTITIQCGGISTKFGNQLVAILNRIAKNQLDPDVVMAKLDEIQRGIAEIKGRTQGVELEASAIRTLELRIELDVPTASSAVDQRMSSVGLAVPVALFDAQKARYRFVNLDHQFGDWQVQPTVHRFEFVCTPETPTELLGHGIGFLAGMEVLGINYADFIRQALHLPPADGDVRFHFNLLVNGIEVVNETRSAPVRVLTEGMATMDVGSAFKRIESVYKERLLQRAGGH
jgi:hypothetical protein